MGSPIYHLPSIWYDNWWVAAAADRPEEKIRHWRPNDSGLWKRLYWYSNVLLKIKDDFQICITSSRWMRLTCRDMESTVNSSFDFISDAFFTYLIKDCCSLIPRFGNWQSIEAEGTLMASSRQWPSTCGWTSVAKLC